MSETGFQLDAFDWENLAFRTAPAALQNLGVSRSGRHSVFRELLFWHFRAAERVLGAKIWLQKAPRPGFGPKPAISQ